MAIGGLCRGRSGARRGGGAGDEGEGVGGRRLLLVGRGGRFKQRPVSTGVLAPPGGGRETRAAVMTDRHKLKTQDVTHKILQEGKIRKKKVEMAKD